MTEKNKINNTSTQYIVGLFNESYKSGELSTSQKQSIIVLLAKKDTDRQFLKNWRPISLLNTDYKIAASVLALRIKTVLPSLIHSDQIGYIKGRLINDAVRTIADIIHHTNKENKPGALLFLDFKKAFDTVSFNYLLKCLKRFNFGPSFINWIQVLYKNANSCVMNGGISSGFFNIEGRSSLFGYLLRSACIAMFRHPTNGKFNIRNNDFPTFEGFYF